MRIICFAVLALVSQVLSANGGDSFSPKEWPNPSFRGRSVWPMFQKKSHRPEHYGADGKGVPTGRGLENLTLAQSYATLLFPDVRLGVQEFVRGDMVFDEKGHRTKLKPKKGEKFVYAKRVPAEALHKGRYSFGDFLGPDLSNLVYRAEWDDRRLFNPQPGAPLLATLPESRPAYFLMNDLKPDRADFLRWKASHPGFIGFYAMGEIDSDTGNYVGGLAGNYRWRPPEESVRKELARRFPPPKNNREWFENLRRVWAKMVEFHFGENAFWPLYCNNCSLAHMNAALGAAGLINEVSTSCGAPFAFSGMYTRGAARQFGIPFAWYTANFYYGYRRDGRRSGKGNSGTCNRWPRNGIDPSKGKRGLPQYDGCSESLLERQDTYGWLIGAGLIQEEGWSYYSASTTNGIPCPSPFALNFNRLIERSMRIDRGASRTPLAILSPMTEFFSRLGSVSDPTNGCRLHLPAWLLTLVPVRETSDPEGSLDGRRRHGDEGCLFNSPYGDIADVLTADSGQASAKFLDVLLHYDVAVLAGTYRKNELDTAAIRSYVDAGGTLVISSDYVEEGFVPASLAGVGFKGSVPSGQFAKDDRGRVVPLHGAYDLAIGTVQTAKPLLKDENGTTVVYVNRVGKGRVLTLAPRRGLPRRYVSSENSVLEDAEREIRSGDGELGLIRYVLDDVQDRCIPVKVSGDVFWGFSRAKEGWFLWLFNNKGVVKYSGERQEIDDTKKSTVSVDLRTLAGYSVFDADTREEIKTHANGFVLDVSAGGMRFVAIRKGK